MAAASGCELDGVDADPHQMLDDRGMAKGGDRPRNGSGTAGWLRVSADRYLVDEARPAGPSSPRRSPWMIALGTNGAVSMPAERGARIARPQAEGPVERMGIGVDEQFRRIEPMAVRGSEGPRPQLVPGSRPSPAMKPQKTSPSSRGSTKRAVSFSPRSSNRQNVIRGVAGRRRR
jgi:hypothetical protein